MSKIEARQAVDSDGNPRWIEGTTVAGDRVRVPVIECDLSQLLDSEEK